MQQVTKNFTQNRLFFLFLFFALILRIFLLIWSLPFHENADLLRYEDWGRIAHIYGFADTYIATHLHEGKTPNNQPPGSLYIASASFNLYSEEVNIVSKLTHTLPGTFLVLDRNLENTTFKIPSFITDILMGLFAYLVVKRKTTQKQGIIAACFIWFNPIIFYNSMLWGQMDSINNFLFFCSIFLLIRKNLFWSIIFFSVSLFTKLSLLPFLPFYVLVLFFQFSYKKVLLYGFISIIFLIIFTIPISHTNLLWLPQFLLSSSGGEGANITIFAYNFWWVVLHPSLAGYTPNSFSQFIVWSYDVWGYGLFGMFSLPLVWILFKKRNKLSSESIFGLFSLVAFLVFLFLPRMHERYLFPFFPLFATYVAFRMKYVISFLLLILLNLSNLYVVWHPYPLPFPDHFLYTDFFAWIASGGILLIGLDIYKNALRDIIGEDILKKYTISLMRFVKLPNLSHRK